MFSIKTRGSVAGLGGRRGRRGEGGGEGGAKIYRQEAGRAGGAEGEGRRGGSESKHPGMLASGCACLPCAAQRPKGNQTQTFAAAGREGEGRRKKGKSLYLLVCFGLVMSLYVRIAGRGEGRGESAQVEETRSQRVPKSGRCGCGSMCGSVLFWV